jgi:hypothetical protein
VVPTAMPTCFATTIIEGAAGCIYGDVWDATPVIWTLALVEANNISK